MTASTEEAFKAGNIAVVTGGANGIGLAAAKEFASRGMSVVIADHDEEQLTKALDELSDLAPDGAYRGQPCDVSDPAGLATHKNLADELDGKVTVLMCNAGTAMNPGKPWENAEGWKQLIGVNLWGIVHACQTFIPDMLEHGQRSVMINTGSKQGITKPPGNAAYNMSKAGVVAYAEMLAHEFRNMDGCNISAHLLVPGFTYSSMISTFLPDKPPAAWTCEQVSDYMMSHLAEGDFYIVCPDNDVTEEMDQKRIQWYADDLIKNRPALSRWHPDFADEFESFMKS